MKPRWVAAVITFGGVLGLVLGAVVAGALYEPLTGLGAADPFPGFEWVLIGAPVGLLVGAAATGWAAFHAMRSRWARLALGTVLGAVTVGTFAGLMTFQSTAPDWVLPVAAASVLGAAMGAVLGRGIASGRAPLSRTPR